MTYLVYAFSHCGGGVDVLGQTPKLNALVFKFLQNVQCVFKRAKGARSIFQTTKTSPACKLDKAYSKPGHGKVLVRNEPLASIVAGGLEGYANGAFQLRAEVKRFFEQYPEFPKNAKGEVSNEHVNRILSRVIFAGHIQSDIMDVSLRPAQNEPFISLATFQKIQTRMQEKAKIPARKDLNEDFPLRGRRRCSCDNPLTACWTKGRSKHYPYYYCFTKGCESYGKAIQREKIEGEFESLLHTLEPAAPLFKTATKMFESWWRYRQAQIAQRGQALEDEIRKLGYQDRAIDGQAN